MATRNADTSALMAKRTYRLAGQCSKGKGRGRLCFKVRNAVTAWITVSGFDAEMTHCAWRNGSRAPRGRFMMPPMARVMASSVSVFVLTCVLVGGAQEGAPEHPGKALVASRCGTCHDAGSVLQAPRTRDDWTETIDQMIKDGAQVSDQEFHELFDYLLRNHSLVNVNKAPADDLAVGLDVDATVARAVVTYRTDHGPFKTIDDLKQVPGIDAARLDARAKRLRY